jgi:cytochrome c2
VYKLGRMRSTSTPLLAGLVASGFIALCAAGALAQGASAPAEGGPDAAAGGLAFLQCSDCHSPGASDGVGPGLLGIVGRRAGSRADFMYSPAMAQSTIVWDAMTLDKFLASPKAVVPGTSMDFPGVQDPVERANLVAYLAGLK